MYISVSSVSVATVSTAAKVKLNQSLRYNRENSIPNSTQPCRNHYHPNYYWVNENISETECGMKSFCFKILCVADVTALTSSQDFHCSWYILTFMIHCSSFHGKMSLSAPLCAHLHYVILWMASDTVFALPYSNIEIIIYWFCWTVKVAIIIQPFNASKWN